MNHQDIEKRSLFLHKKIVEKLLENPYLWTIPIDNLNRWKKTSCKSTYKYLLTWEDLVLNKKDVCLKKMVEWSDEAIALRQSTPFSGVLTNKERIELLNWWVENEKKRF
jgi:hypothetical protein